jgi:hypothetical protein
MFKVMDNLEVVKDFIQTAVDNTVGAVESTHNAIANASFRVVQQGAGDSEKVAAMKEKHDAAVSQVYGAIREVNRSLGQLASDFFESTEDSVQAAKNMAASRSQGEKAAE